MTLGQEFTAFGHTILEDVQRLGEAQALIREINMGATAIGTGITAPAGYAEAVRAHLSRITKLELITAPDLVEATADTGAFVQLSGVLKRCAVKLSKICNDLRLLSSGPRAGLGEIDLPADAAGLVDHAGQGEPGDPRSREPGVLRHHRRRPHRDDRRRSRPAAAQRVRAGDRLPTARRHRLAHQRAASSSASGASTGSRPTRIGCASSSSSPSASSPRSCRCSATRRPPRSRARRWRAAAACTSS